MSGPVRSAGLPLQCGGRTVRTRCAALRCAAQVWVGTPIDGFERAKVRHRKQTNTQAHKHTSRGLYESHAEGCGRRTNALLWLRRAMRLHHRMHTFS